MSKKFQMITPLVKTRVFFFIRAIIWWLVFHSKNSRVRFKFLVWKWAPNAPFSKLKFFLDVIKTFSSLSLFNFCKKTKIIKMWFMKIFALKKCENCGGFARNWSTSFFFQKWKLQSIPEISVLLESFMRLETILNAI